MKNILISHALFMKTTFLQLTNNANATISHVTILKSSLNHSVLIESINANLAINNIF